MYFMCAGFIKETYNLILHFYLFVQDQYFNFFNLHIFHKSKQAGILVKKLASKQGVAGSIPTASKNINHSNFPAQKSVCTSSNHFSDLRIRKMENLEFRKNIICPAYAEFYAASFGV